MAWGLWGAYKGGDRTAKKGCVVFHFEVGVLEQRPTGVDGLDLDALDGWVFKARSPSCAVQPIDVIHEKPAEGLTRAHADRQALHHRVHAGKG